MKLITRNEAVDLTLNTYEKDLEKVNNAITEAASNGLRQVIIECHSCNYEKIYQTLAKNDFIVNRWVDGYTIKVFW